MKNIVLIGFMGTGKTSTGKLLASRLGYAFVDLDHRIEAENHMTIQEMFAQHGEAYFRSCETTMVKKMAARQQLVISTGGGTVKNPANMEMLRKNGIIVSLTADVDTILQRTGRRGTRPVLDQQDQGNRRQAVVELLTERRALYEQADYILDTSRLSPLQVAEAIVRLLKKGGAVHA